MSRRREAPACGCRGGPKTEGRWLTSVASGPYPICFMGSVFPGRVPRLRFAHDLELEGGCACRQGQASSHSNTNEAWRNFNSAVKRYSQDGSLSLLPPALVVGHGRAENLLVDDSQCIRGPGLYASSSSQSGRLPGPAQPAYLRLGAAAKGLTVHRMQITAVPFVTNVRFDPEHARQATLQVGFRWWPSAITNLGMG